MRILVIAMCDSVHTARWVWQMQQCGISVCLFPSTPHRRIHPQIRVALRTSGSALVSMRRFDRWTALPFGLLDLVVRKRLQSWRLRRLLQRESYDLVHLLETQHAGYLFLASVAKSLPRLNVALSVWGSDLIWFRDHKCHQDRIRKTLNCINLLFIECNRDQFLARDLGFAGMVSQPMSAGGGVGSIKALEDEWVTAKRPSERRAIVVKGYTGFVGQARSSLKAIIQNADLLQDFIIHVYSCGLWMRLRIVFIRFKYSLNIHSYRKRRLTHDQVLALFRQARVSLSLSLSDGLPGSFREAAWTGAFPIESVGSCIGEWAEPGRQVLLVNPTDINSAADALRIAVETPDLVDQAWVMNYELAKQYSTETTEVQMLNEYKRLNPRLTIRHQ